MNQTILHATKVDDISILESFQIHLGMILRISFFILLIIIVNGCKKKPQIELNGMVTEFYSGEPVNDAVVELLYFPLNYGSVSSGTQSISSSTTDASGDYSIMFEEPSASSYKIVARKNGYILQSEPFSTTEVSSKEENIINISMYLDASLRLRLYNNDNPTAQVLFRLGKHSEDCESCCNEQSPYTVKGINDTIVECSLYGNQSINYEITRITTGATETQTGILDIQNDGLEVEFDY